MNEQTSYRPLSLIDFENFLNRAKFSFHHVKYWIENDKPAEAQIFDKVQTKLIELRDNIIVMLELSGVFLENFESTSGSIN